MTDNLISYSVNLVAFLPIPIYPNNLSGKYCLLLLEYNLWELYAPLLPGNSSLFWFQGSVPRMVAESNCRYEVEWVTEYACHRDYLESHTCKLTSEQHDISIDLSPLTLGCKSKQELF